MTGPEGVGPERAAAFLRKVGVAPERARTLLTAEVGTTPSETVYEENTLELRRYTPERPRHRTPILLVYALVNRPYILDLQPDRSVIRRLTEAGFRVYLVDWGEPSRLDRSLSLADYVCRYLDNCVERVREAEGVEDVHLLGYCMGGTMSVMYTCLHPEPVRTLGLLAAPIAFDGTGGILERWASHIDPAQAVETLGNVPAELLAAEFAMMDPVDQFLGKYVTLYDNLEDEAFVANFARMERWIWDGVDVAGAAFREFVAELYQDNRLIDGEFELDGRPVRPGGIDVPVLQVVGEYDHIVPPESSRPLNDRVDATHIEFPRGHIGISVSGKAHRELWPRVCRWYAERDAGGDRAGGDRDGEPTVGERLRTVAAAAGAAAGAQRSARTAGAAERERSYGVGTVTGIGPTYAERLREAGIETVADLAEREASTLAEVTGAPVGRAENWLERV